MWFFCIIASAFCRSQASGSRHRCVASPAALSGCRRPTSVEGASVQVLMVSDVELPFPCASAPVNKRLTPNSGHAGAHCRTAEGSWFGALSSSRQATTRNQIQVRTRHSKGRERGICAPTCTEAHPRVRLPIRGWTLRSSLVWLSGGCDSSAKYVSSAAPASSTPPFDWAR